MSCRKDLLEMRETWAYVTSRVGLAIEFLCCVGLSQNYMIILEVWGKV